MGSQMTRAREPALRAGSRPGSLVHASAPLLLFRLCTLTVGPTCLQAMKPGPETARDDLRALNGCSERRIRCWMIQAPRRPTSTRTVQAERGKHQALSCAPEHRLHRKPSVWRPFRLSVPLARRFRFCITIRPTKLRTENSP